MALLLPNSVVLGQKDAYTVHSSCWKCTPIHVSLECMSSLGDLLLLMIAPQSCRTSYWSVMTLGHWKLQFPRAILRSSVRSNCEILGNKTDRTRICCFIRMYGFRLVIMYQQAHTLAGDYNVRWYLWFDTSFT